MKKKISLLCASIITASNTNALVINPGDNVLLVFYTSGVGNYIIDTGVSADQIIDGAGFSINISPAASALGGVAESFALVGLTSQTAPEFYNYSEFVYVYPGAGLLYTNTYTYPATIQSDTDLQDEILALQNQFSALNLGFNPIGSLPPSPTTPFAFGLELLKPLSLLGPDFLSGNNIGLFHQYQSNTPTSGSASDAEKIEILGSSPSAIRYAQCTGYELSLYNSVEHCAEFASGYDPKFTLSDDIFTLYGEYSTVNAVPIPATNFMFLSALGLARSIKRFYKAG